MWAEKHRSLHIKVSVIVQLILMKTGLCRHILVNLNIRYHKFLAAVPKLLYEDRHTQSRRQKDRQRDRQNGITNSL